MSAIIPAAQATITTQENHNRLHGLIPQSYLEDIGRAIYANVSRGLWAAAVTCKVQDKEALEYLVEYLTTLGYRVYWHREGEKVTSLLLVWKKDYLVHSSWEIPDFNDPPTPPTPPTPPEGSRPAFSPQVGNPKNLKERPTIIPDKGYLGWLARGSDEALVAAAILSNKLVTRERAANVHLRLTQAKLELLQETLVNAGYSVSFTLLEGEAPVFSEAKLVKFRIEW